MAGGYRFLARGGKAADILIYEDVGALFGGVTGKQVYQDLKDAGPLNSINVRINSYGGEVFEGLTIYRHLADHPAVKNVYVDGIAASIASVIAMCGDTISIAQAGRMMIHEAASIVVGRAADMRSMADQLDSMSGSIADLYSARTGMDAADCRKMMAAETWFTADQAVEKRFATAIVENTRAVARFDPKLHAHIKHPPRDLIGSIDRPLRDAAARRIAVLAARINSAR